MAAENKIRGYYEPACCGWEPGTGPNVPAHWLDGGHGWVTAHFRDVEPFSFENRTAGRHQCAMPSRNGGQCNFEVQGNECCSCACCWCPHGNAPREMEHHLNRDHGISAPEKREWATGCTETPGCCEAVFCWPCAASRQLMAAHGYSNELNCFWCMYFTCAVARSEHDDGKAHTACASFAAWLTRRSIVKLNNIDESFCSTTLLACCCPCCSLAQTYREYSAAGVWPGGICNAEPPAVRMNNPPPQLDMPGTEPQPGPGTKLL